MSLTDEQKQYKLFVVKEGSKRFFATNIAKEWDFETYFESTHNDINKNKHITKIQKDYDSDLNWITQLEEVPIGIKEYARALIKKEKPKKAVLKASLAKRANKKRKLTGQTVIINGTINGGTINNINSISNSEVHFTNEPSSSKKDKVLKRRHEGGEEDAKEVSDKEDEEQNVEQRSMNSSTPSIWLDWINYVHCHAVGFHPYSPEANNIIRSGKGVSPKPYLDRDLYNKHMETRCIEGYPMPQTFHEHIDAYVDSDDLLKAKKKIRSLSLLLSMEEDGHHDANNMEFLEQLLTQAEDTFNQLFVWPYLDVIGKSITLDDCKSDFVQGQPYLESMKRQLKTYNLYIDDKSQYKSDGLIKLFGLKELELLLLETSGCFINKDKSKTNFDHHKGVFGALAMLKCIADDYTFASIEKFTEVKVFFLHAADTKLHLWSVCYQKENVFDLWRESSLHIKPDFQDKEDFIPDLIQFCWEAKCTMEESVRNIVALKEEHNIIKPKYRYCSELPVLLSDIISPIILKLTKEEDFHGMSGLGPIYSPSHP